jgi:hypothetical protein
MASLKLMNITWTVRAVYGSLGHPSLKENKLKRLLTSMHPNLVFNH